MLLRYYIIETDGCINEVTADAGAMNEAEVPSSSPDTLRGSLHIDDLVKEGLTDAYEERGLDAADMAEQEALCLQRVTTEILLVGTNGVKYHLVLDFMSHKKVYRTMPEEEQDLIKNSKDVIAENALFASSRGLRALVKGKLVLGRVVISFREVLDAGRTHGEDDDFGWDFVDVATVASQMNAPVGEALLGEALRGHVMEPVLATAMQQQEAKMRGELRGLEVSTLPRDAVLLARYRAVLPPMA